MTQQYPIWLAAVSRKKASAGAVNTLQLAHFNGADQQTSTTDEVPTVIWEVSAGAKLTTANKQFGTAGMQQNDGSLWATPWTSPHSGDWTFEGWLRPDSNLCYVVLDTNGAAAYSCLVYFMADAFGNNFTAQYLDSTPTALTGINNDTFAIGAWSDTVFKHVALVRSGTSYFFYFDGNRIGNVTNATNVATFNRVFLYGGTTAVWDEVRISKVARYTGATYTVPTSAFTVD